ncbi:putative Ig domain-containing protein [Pleomorphomonas diazotrophica]|uniref:putative Ig domain-containing protein n=1 Tax=Pleomorphomonas diazotrophica TaxID=1166257 RepID=UPI0015D5BC67|nr:putative Ig domain-containing protein [Pleomorphomonas diazotrophica]
MRVHRSFLGAMAAILAACLHAQAAPLAINDNNTHIDRGVLYTNELFLTGSGGTGPYTFQVNSGLPPGVVVNSAGQISGATCGSNGNFPLSVTVTDSVGGTLTATNKALLVNAAPAGGCSLTFTSSAPTSTAYFGQPYSFSFATSGGSGSVVYSVGSGAVPTGLSLSSSGTLSGTPSAQGTFTFSIWASEGSNTGSSANYTITVGAAPAGLAAISGVAPNTGPTTGGTTVTLTGTGFTGTTGVTFGGTAGTSVNVVSDTSLTVVTPAGTIGAVAVAVTNGVGTGTLPSAYTYALASQTISFANPGAQSFGTSPTLTATADSGLAVSFASSTTGVCTITSGGVLTFVTAGTCTITASQTGDATYAAATPAQQSFNVNGVIPGAPVIGTATAGDGEVTVSFTAPASSGGAAITGYTVTSDPGGITATGSSSPITVSGLTNGVAYSFTVTATNSVGTGAASAPSNAVTPLASQTITFNNPGAQSFGTNPTLSATSSSGLSVSFSSATTGVCTITGGGALAFVAAGTCAISADQAGDASYIPAATVQQSFTVNPVVPGAPVIGTATAGDGEVTVSFTAPASSGGAAITGYTVTSDPGGITATGSSSPITVSGLTNGVAYSFTVTATNSVGTGAASAPSNAVTPLAALTAPVAGAASATVAANSTANPVALVLGGDAATSVAVDTAASHGTASASGTTITYTPASGFSGSDSFTYTATNSAGTSSPETVSITVTAPTLALSPAGGALPEGTKSAAYGETLSASLGTAPYAFTVTSGSLPSGLGLNTSTGTISGTPITAGAYSFTVTATDAHGATGSANYSLTINAPVASLVFIPAGGALPEAMAGEAYSQSISASGGSGSLLYSLASGALPQGLVLNVSTGALNGPLSDTATSGDYSFTLQVTDGNGSTATAAFTLKVNERVVTVTDKVVNVPAGDAPLNVDLEREATGGPFTAAELVNVSPPNAGTVSIVNGEFAAAGPVGTLGWYLKFIPNPTYKGQVSVTFRLTSALGISNLGVVYYNVAYDPEDVAVNVDTLVHGFVEARQNLLASTVAVPGLLERRRMAEARTPISGRVTPGEGGVTAMFATSLAEMEAVRNLADGVTAAPSAFNAWVSGTVMLHEREENGGRWGSFALLSAGADYLLGERALIGLSLHYDRMTDPTDQDATLTGNGWLAGPYASFEVADGLYWDTSLLYGGSSNDIETSFWNGRFDTSRWMLDSSLKGEIALGEGRLTPTLRALYLSETVNDYAIDNADGDVMELKGFTTDQLRVSLGAEYSRDIRLDDGAVLTPRLGVIAGFSGLDGSGAFGSLSAGLTFSPREAWNVDLGLLLGVEGDGQTSAGAKIGLSGRF